MTGARRYLLDLLKSLGPWGAFYGALFANAVFQPIAGKLKTRHDEELLVKQLVIKGLMGISRGENPRLLSQQLEAELAPADRTGEG